MGDKVVARETAKNAGVPVAWLKWAHHRSGRSSSRSRGDRLPSPVKAAGGGGGIGMALVKRANKLERAIESCRDRGQSSFGNEAVYLEKYIESPRHIEVQVLFDQHEHGIHLFERSARCSGVTKRWSKRHRLPSSLRKSHCAMNSAKQRYVPHAPSVIAMGTVEFVMSQTGEFTSSR